MPNEFDAPNDTEDDDPTEQEERIEREMDNDDEIRRRLRVEGYQDDELDKLFDTPEKLREFYQEHFAAGQMHVEVNKGADAEETDPEPEDDFEMSDEQKAEFGLKPQTVIKPKPGRIVSIIDTTGGSPRLPRNLSDILDEHELDDED